MELTVLIIVGTLSMLLLSGFVILFVIMYQKKVIANKHEMQVAENKFQQQLIESVVVTEQNERERIAKNLHDDLGSSLTALRLNIQNINLNKSGTEQNASMINNSLQLLNQTIQDLRRISHDLMPSTLLRFGFVNALRDLCKTLESTSLSVRFNINGSPEKLETNKQVQLYYISKELINNIIKHSGTNMLEILILADNNETLTLVFKYNGDGISNSDVAELYKQNKGIGLKNIESRLRTISGKIDYIKNGAAESSIHLYLS